MKLTAIRLLGRYVNPETGRPVNVHKARRVGRGGVLFFYRSGKRVLITDRDFYSQDQWNEYRPRRKRVPVVTRRSTNGHFRRPEL